MSDYSQNFPAVTCRWFKKMNNTDAQQPRSKTEKITHNLRLNQAGFKIDQKRWFRDVLFGELNWQTKNTPKPIESTYPVFNVWIDKERFSKQELRVSYKLSRIANQNNISTVLHWGPLTHTLKSRDFVGYYVAIERLANNEFNLIISPDPTGEFLG